MRTDDWLTANKEMGTFVLQPQELNSGNNLNQLGSEFFPQISR